MRCAALLALAASFWLAPGLAHAHGREPVVGAIAFDPLDPSHLVARTTWTLLESRDGGASWVWRCAVAVGYERTTEDPPIVVASDRRVLAGVFNGVVRGDETGCTYAPVADPDVERLYVIDMVPDPVSPSTVWAITSPGDRPNTVVRSTDDGVSWELRGAPRAEVLLERLRVAPSDPSRVYTTGVIPRRMMDPRRAFFYASTDGGMTFAETEIPLEGEERNVHVLAVDPTNPARALVRVVRLVTDEAPERLLLTEDGGRTFATAASLLEITGAAFSADGARAWVGGWDGAFLRSEMGGAAGSFAPVPGHEALRVRCLAHRPLTATTPDELWICTDDLRGDFAIGRSTDGGTTIERIWGFSDVRVDTECAAGTPVGEICPMYYPDVLFDLGLTDAGMPMDDAGLVGADVAPRPTCACRARGGPQPLALAMGLGLVAALARRRARSR